MHSVLDWQYHTRSTYLLNGTWNVIQLFIVRSKKHVAYAVGTEWQRWSVPPPRCTPLQSTSRNRLKSVCIMTWCLPANSPTKSNVEWGECDMKGCVGVGRRWGVVRVGNISPWPQLFLIQNSVTWRWHIFLRRPVPITTPTTHSRNGISTNVTSKCLLFTKGPPDVKRFWTRMEIRLFVINTTVMVVRLIHIPVAESSSGPRLVCLLQTWECARVYKWSDCVTQYESHQVMLLLKR
jgi:hypothetical protein